MSIKPVVTKFHNSSLYEKSVTPVFRTQQYLFHFKQFYQQLSEKS